MNANKLAIAFGMLAMLCSCTTTTTPSTQKQASQVTAVTSEAVTGTIKIDRSSTVYPITQAIAKDFQADPNNKTQVEVKISGTTGGFKKFCAGETDISNASRPILKAEMEACNKNGIRYMELPIAFDALTVFTKVR